MIYLWRKADLRSRRRPFKPQHFVFAVVDHGETFLGLYIYVAVIKIQNFIISCRGIRKLKKHLYFVYSI